MRFLAIVGLFFSLSVHAMIIDAPDGIIIGSQTSPFASRLPLYRFDEQCKGPINLGTFSANEVKTIVISSVDNVSFADTVLAHPQNPPYLEAISLKYSWASDDNEVSLMLRNDTSSEQTPLLQDQWCLTIISTQSL